MQEIDFHGDDPREIQIAMSVKAELDNAYPGYPWHVSVDIPGGMCDVRLEFNGKYGFRMHLQAAASASEFSKNVIWAGGELLERNMLPRGRANQDVIESLPTGIDGMVQADRG